MARRRLLPARDAAGLDRVTARRRRGRDRRAGSAGSASAPTLRRPDRPGQRRRRPRRGFARVLNRKYYIDEIYDARHRPAGSWLSRVVLWRGVDQGLVDGVAVNGTAWFWRVGSAADRQPAADGPGGYLRACSSSWARSGSCAPCSGDGHDDRFLDSIGYDALDPPRAHRCSRSSASFPCCSAPERSARSARRWSSRSLEFVLSLGLWWALDPGGPAMQFVSSAPWIPQLGHQLSRGLDGISLVMVLLTTALMPLSVLAQLALHRRSGSAASTRCMLALQTGHGRRLPRARPLPLLRLLRAAC